MNDPIDRQAAIDALRYAQHRFTVADEAGGIGTVKWSEDVIYFAAAERILTDLPPAQPEPCGDVVSRNAIIQKLNTMDRYVSEELILCDTDKKFPQNEVFIVDDVYEEIVEQLPSAQPDLSGYSDRLWKAAYERGKAEAQRTGKWIPCSSQLPELDVYVIATTQWYEITMACRIGDGEWFIHEDNANAYDDDILAWMPLPEPYRP